ncbi:MAG TPA: 2OG-Fe(II) oxygenase [Burkholderiales bacterium]|nr:2OG-Fe(II) oxygenase [Burkholderiales bacterium]
MSHSSDEVEEDRALLETLGAQGWAVQHEWAPALAVRELARQARAEYAAGSFTAAGVGRGSGRTLVPTLRGDRIHWLDGSSGHSAQVDLLRRFEGLRISANRALMLGLYEVEAHFALYPSGASYGRHIDRFREDDARVLSVVLYLNEAWAPDEGGQLRLELSSKETVDILPTGGTLVCFLSDRFQHEVLPATRDRLSVAGWFKRREIKL